MEDMLIEQQMLMKYSSNLSLYYKIYHFKKLQIKLNIFICIYFDEYFDHNVLNF